MVESDDWKEIEVKTGQRRRVSQKLKVETVGIELWNRPRLTYERGKCGRRHAGGGGARPYTEVSRVADPCLICCLSTPTIPFCLGVCHANDPDRSRGGLASNCDGFDWSRVGVQGADERLNG